MSPTNVCVVKRLPVLREGQRGGLSGFLPQHTPPSTVHVGTLHRSHRDGVLQTYVSKTQPPAGGVQGDGRYPANAVLDENGREGPGHRRDLQTGLRAAAPVDAESHPVQGHGGDGVAQEFEVPSPGQHFRVLQLEGAQRIRAVVCQEQGVVAGAVVHDGCLGDVGNLQRQVLRPALQLCCRVSRLQMDLKRSEFSKSPDPCR